MSDSVVPLELAEMRAFADLYRSASPQVVEQCGVVHRELEAGVVLAATRLDVLALNRALGVGLAGRPSDDQLTDMLDAFESIGSARFFVQVAPIEGSAELPSRLEKLGLRHYNNWIRLSRELVDLPEAPATNLTVRRIGGDEADSFSRIVAAAFGYPPAVARSPDVRSAAPAGDTTWPTRAVSQSQPRRCSSSGRRLGSVLPRPLRNGAVGGLRRHSWCIDSGTRPRTGAGG